MCVEGESPTLSVKMENTGQKWVHSISMKFLNVSGTWQPQRITSWEGLAMQRSGVAVQAKKEAERNERIFQDLKKNMLIPSHNSTT